MKLQSFRVTNYKSVLDSGPIDVDEITCLVGKNEAGKSAILGALYRLNPIRPEDAAFSITDDYPRMDVSDYEDKIAKGAAHEAVIEVSYELEKSEIGLVEAVFGKNFLRSNFLTVTKNYGNTRQYTLTVSEHEAIAFLSRNLSSELQNQITGVKTAGELSAILESHPADPAVAAILDIVRTSKGHSFGWYTFNKILHAHEPKYLYFDEYYQMAGCENIEALQQREAEKKLLPSDQPLLGLIELARLALPQMLAPDRTQDLKNKLEGAGNHLTKQIVPYWSQNKHLQLRFDIRPARPGDPVGMRTGTNIWGEVFDTRHFASTGLGTRSKGFVWFFSFVAWYSQVKRRNEKVILLLDEPGLTLHGRAQGDLLRYFESELKPNNQLIYSTHSPFMVDPHHFSRVRIVQDLSIDVDGLPKDQQGTKVSRDILEATEDSLFPLQGALGYDIHQTLFIGPNTLLVEGPSDLLYLQGLSSILQREGREGLSEKWTITPVGGSGRIPTFVRLLTNQKGMIVATLIDIQESDRQTVEDLYKKKLLKKSNVVTFATYVGSDEADIEDMFDQSFYIKLMSAEYGSSLKSPLDESKLNRKMPRILKRLQAYFEQTGSLSQPFSHYRPARYFHENLAAITPMISAETKERVEKVFQDLNALLT